jgi:AcrR family transcriptional regulator
LSVEDRREVVLDAARDLFATSGRAVTTVDAVAQRAGVQKPSVYRLYASKDELYRAAVEREAARFRMWLEQRYAETTSDPIEARIRARARGVVEYTVRERSGMALLTRAMHSWPDEQLAEGVELRDRVIELLARFARDEGARDGFEMGAAAEAMAAITFGLTQSVIELAILDERWDTDTLADLLAETAVAAIMRSDPRIWGAFGAATSGRGTSPVDRAPR